MGPAGVYLFSLRESDKETVKLEYLRSETKKDYAIFGILGNCDLAILDYTGAFSQNIIKMIKQKRGSNVSTFHYFAPFEKPHKRPKKITDIRTLCFLQSRPDNSTNLLKLRGFFQYLLPLKDTFQNAMSTILSLREKDIVTLCMPVVEFHHLFTGCELGDPCDAIITLKAFPGRESACLSFLNGAIGHKVFKGEKSSPRYTHGNPDAALYHTGVHIDGFLRYTWTTTTPGLHSTTTNILTDPIDAKTYSHSNDYDLSISFPFHVPDLIDGYDCTLIKRKILNYVEVTRKKLKLEENTFTLTPHLLKDLGSPTVNISHPQNATAFCSEVYLNSEDIHVNDSIWKHEIELGFIAGIFQLALSIKKIDILFDNHNLTYFENFFRGVQLSIGESAATCLLISRTNVPDNKKMESAVTEIWPPQDTLKQVDVARIILATVLLKATDEPERYLRNWFRLFEDAIGEVNQIVTRCYPKATIWELKSPEAFLEICRKYFFLGIFNEIKALNLSYQARFEIVSAFSSGWLYTISAINNLRGKRQPIKSKKEWIEHETRISAFGKALSFTGHETTAALCAIMPFRNHEHLDFQLLLSKFFADAERTDQQTYEAIHSFANTLSKMHRIDSLAVEAKFSEFYSLEDVPMGYELLSKSGSESFAQFMWRFTGYRPQGNYLEKPDDYQAYQFLRRIQVELLCLGAINRALDPPKVTEGQIISINTVPWLLYPMTYPQSQNGNGSARWQKGNPYFEAYRAQFLSLVLAILKKIKSQGGHPYLELTEGEISYPHDFSVIYDSQMEKGKHLQGNEQKSYQWSTFWQVIKELVDQVPDLGIGIDDQYGNGTDLERFKAILKAALKVGVKRFMVKIDGKVIDHVAMTTNSPASVIHSLINIPYSCFETPELHDLIIVLEGYDGYVRGQEQNHRLSYRQHLKTVKTIQDKLAAEGLGPEGFKAQIFFQGF